jgi:hypothetical protein
MCLLFDLIGTCWAVIRPTEESVGRYYCKEVYFTFLNYS